MTTDEELAPLAVHPELHLVERLGVSQEPQRSLPIERAVPADRVEPGAGGPDRAEALPEMTATTVVVDDQTL